MKEKSPLSVKLETELSTRLDECSRRTKIKKYSLALMAIEAAVEAIEQNDYRLVVPIQFEVSEIPAKAHPDESIKTRLEFNDSAPPAATGGVRPETTGKIVQTLKKYGPLKHPAK